MLMLILAATTVAQTPQQKTEAPCAAAATFVSKTVDPPGDRSEPDALPRDKADTKGPAVLLPACKEQPRKKKDYPLA